MRIKKKLALLLASALLVTSMNVMPVEATTSNTATGSDSIPAVANTNLSLSIAALNSNQGNTVTSATGNTVLSLAVEELGENQGNTKKEATGSTNLTLQVAALNDNQGNTKKEATGSTTLTLVIGDTEPTPDIPAGAKKWSDINNGDKIKAGTIIYNDTGYELTLTALTYACAVYEGYKSDVSYESECKEEYDTYKNIYGDWIDIAKNQTYQVEKTYTAYGDTGYKIESEWWEVNKNDGKIFPAARPGESYNPEPDPDPTTDTQITSMTVNIDWSKIPTLTVGQDVSDFEEFPGTVSGTGVDANPEKLYCVWAVKANESHVSSGYIDQETYDEYTTLFDNWIPLEYYENYTINATDTYGCYITVAASDGYCFTDYDGYADLKDIVTSNITEYKMISNGESRKSAVGGFKLGTVNEIKIAKGETPLTEHTITATAGANGSISPSGSVKVTEGDDQKFNITPNAGYEIDTLTVDGKPETASTSYTFRNVTAAHTIAVTFKQVSSTPDPGAHTHTIVTDAAVAPTCTEAGKTEGKHCSVCGEIITAQTTVVALGHDWSNDWVITKLATATTEGKKECTCKREGCNQKKYEVIPVIGTPTDPNEGKLDKDAEVTPEAPIEEATLDNTKTELLNAPSIFTTAEKQAIENGADARVWMEVSKTDESSIPSADKTKISDAATSIMGENPSITYFDADLFKQVGDGAATQLHEPGIDIEVTIKVPENLRNADSGFEREYKIIRLHTDVATGASLVDILSGTFDKVTGEFTFKTDKFSTYAIAYTDKKLVTGVTLTPETATLTQAGQSVQLTATVAPADATDKSVTWASSNINVATVDANGKVTAVASGTCTITATTEDGAKTAECKITVNIPSQPSIPSWPSTPSQPNTPVQPDTPGQPDTPDQPDTPVQPDTPGTTVTVTKEQKEKNALALNAKLKVSQTKSQLDIVWGEVSGADGYNVYAAYCGTKFTKKSLNQVKSGKITKLIVKKINGKKLNLKKNYKIYVEAYKLVDGKQVILGRTLTAHIVGGQNTGYTNVKDIKLKKTSLPLKKGKTATIQAEAVLVDKSKKQLTDAHTKEFRYATSNKKVATVSSEGKIKAVGKGTCTIYVYARNGYAKKVKVTVK